MKIEALKLTTRFCNALHEAGVHTVEELQKLEPSKIKALPGIGKTGCQAIAQALKEKDTPE